MAELSWMAKANRSKALRFDPAAKFKKRPGDNEEIGVGKKVTTDSEGKWRYDSVPIIQE